MENKLEDIVSKIESLTAIELAELVKILEEKFGISTSSASIAASAESSQKDKEEKTSFNVILKNAGSSKINVIKVVKEIMAIGLKEAKDVVDGAPKTIKEGVKKEEAEEIEKKLKQAGAETELQ